MSTSLLLTEKSKVTFILPGSTTSPTDLDIGQATISGTYSGTVTWEISTDSNCTIYQHKVVLSLDNVSVSATTGPYVTPNPGSGSLSASKIAKVVMSSKKPMCEADGSNFSVNGSCYYVDDHGVTQTNTYTCTCTLIAVQTKVSGLIS